MRNYRGLTEFVGKASIDQLQYFDDEYFVVLKHNMPYLAAFPVLCGEHLESASGFSREYLTVTSLQRKDFPEFRRGTVYYVMKDSRPYYCIIQYSVTEVDECAAFLRNHFRSEYDRVTLENSENRRHG